MAIVWKHTLIPLDLNTKRVRINALRSDMGADGLPRAESFRTDFVTVINTAALAAERTRIRDEIRSRYTAWAAQQVKIAALTTAWAATLDADQQALET